MTNCFAYVMNAELLQYQRNFISHMLPILQGVSVKNVHEYIK